MSKKEYKLDEAIKNFYTTAPLKTNLAKTIPERVFMKPEEVRSPMDKWLYVFAVILVFIGLMYSFSFFQHISMPAFFLILFSIVSFAGLARKEYSLFSRRLLSMN